MPVSYTHLDVYKRQLQSTMMSVYGMADRQYIVKAAEKDVIAELTDELLPGFRQGLSLIHI